MLAFSLLIVGLLIFNFQGTSGRSDAVPRISEDDINEYASDTFVHGGEDAQLGELPYHVSLNRFNRPMCGGSLLSDRWLVTAAHCVPRGGSTRGYWVTAGTNDLRRPEGKGQYIDVAKIVVHPDFKGRGRNGSDIAMVKLKKPVELNNNTKTIQLPSPDHRATGKTLISGWGKTENGPTYMLKKVILDIFSDEQCNKDYESRRIKILDSMICGGDRQGKKSGCFGDSGGPWVDLEKKIVIALVSWGPDTCVSTKFPNVSTEVAYFVPWIKEIMKNNS